MCDVGEGWGGGGDQVSDNLWNMKVFAVLVFRSR